MRSTELSRVFRHVLAVAFVTPVAAGACGGATLDEVQNDAKGTGTSPAPTTGPKGTTPTVPPTEIDGGTVRPDASRPDGIDGGTVKPDAGITDAQADCIDLPPPPGPFLPDANATCDWFVPLPCGIEPDASSVPQGVCQAYCGPSALWCMPGNTLVPGGGDETEVVLHCISCAIGRRPEGFVHGAPREADAPMVGRFFAIAAELEAASVFSFERLERELDRHGAPAALKRRARRAASDEKRHARVTAALAARHGASKVDVPSEGPTAIRELDEVALENAVEGCVRETYGALVATVQAERATDPRVRAAMRQIALDETDHAALAWSVASWLDGTLTAEARGRINAAMLAAIEGLASEVATEPPAALQRIAGLPSASEATALVEGLREMLWAA